MVDEGADRDLLRQFHDAAVVVGVKMRDQQVVNALQPGVFDRGKNAVGVPRFARLSRQRRERAASGKTGVDEQ